jgi:hypothetical protein
MHDVVAMLKEMHTEVIQIKILRGRSSAVVSAAIVNISA